MSLVVDNHSHDLEDNGNIVEGNNDDSNNYVIVCHVYNSLSQFKHGNTVISAQMMTDNIKSIFQRNINSVTPSLRGQICTRVKSATFFPVLEAILVRLTTPGVQLKVTHHFSTNFCNS